MTSLRMRPRFEHDVPDLSPDTIMAKFAQRLKRPDCAHIGRLYTHQVELTVPTRKQHYWSPWLNLVIWKTETGSRLDGRFGPAPRVWTMFMALYGFTLLTAFVGAMFGFSQLQLEMSPWGFYLAGAMLIAAGLFYVIAQVGQRLGAEQMEELHAFALETLDEPVIESATEAAPTDDAEPLLADWAARSTSARAQAA